jgi:hypothetical protein
VHENNAIDECTREPRFITVYWQFGTHGVGVTETITRNGEEDRVLTESELREVDIRYGIVEASAGPIERTLWNIKSRR